jgi:ferredoxin--NADP+ reductase
MLAKHADDLLTTDIPANVYEGLKASPVTDVHVFGRRGPASIKFTPIELRELGEVKDVDIVLYDEDFPDGWFDEDAEGVTNQHKVMARVLESWRGEESTGASRRLHLHFWHKPVAILGEDGKVAGMKFERTQDAGAGAISDTGVMVNYPLQAVYRAIGYFGSEIPGVPFDDKYGVIKNDGGRVVDEHGKRLTGLYATGWIKRGPVGLIGHTKSDAMETIENLVSDLDTLVDPAEPSTDAVLATFAERGVDFTTWEGWLQLNQHEIALGEAFDGVDRERVKVVDRDEQVGISNK